MINKNEYYDVEFIDMTHDAMGVCKINDFPIFVKNALKGEKGKIKIIKLNSSFGFGRLTEVYGKSPFRKTPICDHFQDCGGCNLMHMSYQMQLDFKKYRTNVTLQKLGKIKTDVLPTVGMVNPYYYRNKVIIPFSEKNGELIAGLYKNRTHEIVNINKCYIIPKIATDIVKFLKNIFKELKIPAYNESLHSGIIRYVIIRTSYYNNDIALTIVTNSEELPKQNLIIQRIVSKYNRVKSIIHNVNMKPTNVVLGKESDIIYGEDKIVDSINKVNFEIGHRSFYQINPSQTELLYKKAIEYGELTGEETVIDAYCGIGTIALSVAKNVKKVYGIEIIQAAINNAVKNAKNNDIKNAQFIVGKSEEEIKKLKDKNIDLIFIDPPRKGCDKDFLQTIVEMDIPKIVYISCNVSTLARDLNLLQANNYKIIEVTPFDMFPQTNHIEAVCKIEKIK